MSSTGQATSSTSSTSNIQLISNALVDYTKITGIDLSKNPFAATIKRANSPEAILELLQEREKAFKEYRENNRKLINCLTPAVKVIQAFSGILGEAITLVSGEPQIRSGYSFKQISSGPLPTSGCFVCWDRCSPRCTSLEYALYPFPL
jgi:hypothetical protein